MDVPVRIAAAQLAGGRRLRTVVEAAPFTALLATDGPDFLSYAVASAPGSRVHDVTRALPVLRAAFAPGVPRFELVEEASPGAVEALVAAGIEVTNRYPLLSMDIADAPKPEVPRGVRLDVVLTAAELAESRAVASAAFGKAVDDGGDPPSPSDGGYVLAWLDGQAVATAAWTPVADGVTEIVGVATLPSYQRRGLGSLVTAYAVRSAAELAGVTLPWLTPGDDGADRVYRSIGFSPVATAVHLAGLG